VEAEASFEDPLEGEPTEGQFVEGQLKPAGPVQTKIRELLVPDWDEDSPQLRQNLAHVLEEIVRAAEQRETPTLEAARQWQTLVVRGLDVPDARFVGAFAANQVSRASR